MGCYRVLGEVLASGDAGLQPALARAHDAHQRPVCLCRAGGVEMAVARLGDRCVLKRMPGTGTRHAPGCVSYEPLDAPPPCEDMPAAAVVTDPGSGLTTLRVGFAMQVGGLRPRAPAARRARPRGAEGPGRMSLRGLLHYLWDEAELTRWDPRFAGRRSWATVRHHLLQAAEGKVVGARPLRQRLYVPEVFSAERRDEIRARRLAWWHHASGLDGAATGDGRAGGQTLMLLVGEAKAIVPGPGGGRLVVKHVPDQGFALGERLYRGIARRYAAELAVWTAQASLHLVVAATFRADGARACPVEAVALMTVTAQWLPVADREAVVDVERMVRDGRAFRVRAGGDAIGASVSASARGGVVGSREPPRESRRPVGVSQDGAS